MIIKCWGILHVTSSSDKRCMQGKSFASLPRDFQSHHCNYYLSSFHCGCVWCGHGMHRSDLSGNGRVLYYQRGRVVLTTQAGISGSGPGQKGMEAHRVHGREVRNSGPGWTRERSVRRSWHLICRVLFRSFHCKAALTNKCLKSRAESHVYNIRLWLVLHVLKSLVVVV